MLSLSDAERVAGLYGLGDAAVMSGPMARGEQGQVWRIDITWTVGVEEPFEVPSLEEAVVGACDQEAMWSAGVPMPEMVRTVGGDVVADVGSAVVRVEGWVDLEPVDRWIDPVAGGRLVPQSTASTAMGAARFTGGTASRWVPPAGMCSSLSLVRPARRRPDTGCSPR